MGGRRFELDDLYRIPYVSDPRIAPDGSRIAFVVTSADRDADENRSAIWMVDLATGSIARFTHGPDASAPRWSPDGRWLAYVTEKQLTVLPASGGGPRTITELDAGVGSVAWAPDSRQLLFLSPVGTLDDTAPLVIDRLRHKADGYGLIGGRRQHIFSVSVNGGEPVQWTDGDWSVSGPAWSADGARIAFATSMHGDRDLRVSTAVYVVDAAGAAPTAVTPEDAQLATPVWTPDGALLVVGRLDDAIGLDRLYRVELGGTPLLQCADLDRNVMPGGPGYPGALPQVLADGTVRFCARDHGNVHVFDGGGRKVIGGDDRVVTGMSVAGDRIAFSAATPTSTGEVFVASADGTGERMLTDLVSEALADIELFVPKRRWFTAADGTRVEAWVVAGDDGERKPMLLDVHGGPHNAWGPTFDGVSIHHQVLAAAGWLVAYPNPRGSDGYGEEFYRAVVGGWGANDRQDFDAVLDELIADGSVDADRVAVTGYSYGGFMVNWLTATSDRFRCAVSGGCVSNLLSMSGTDDLGPVFTILENGASAVEDADLLVESSPLRFVDRVTAPTLLLHGLSDDRCPVGQAEEWFAALRTLGVPTRLVLYPGASHTFRLLGRPSHRVDYARRLVDWLAEHG